MTAVDPEAAVRLARRLRGLREEGVADVALTQAQLAAALSEERSVAPATLSSWENVNNPKSPTKARLQAYARFFATPRSVDGVPHLIPAADLEEDERVRYKQLEGELFELYAALDGTADASKPVDRRQLL